MIPCPSCNAHVRPATRCPACGAVPDPEVRRTPVGALLGLGLGFFAAGCEEMYGIVGMPTKDALPELEADPEFLDFVGAGTAEVVVQNTGFLGEGLALAVEPPDLGVSATLDTDDDRLEPGETALLTVTYAPVDLADVAVDVAVTVDGAGVLVPVSGTPPRLDAALSGAFAGLDAEVPCDAAGTFTLTNAGDADLAVVITVPDPVPRFTLALPPDGAVTVPGHGEVSLPVVVDAATPGAEVLAVEVAPDGWVAHPLGASATATVAYADTGEVSVTGETTVALPADADPASVAVTVNGVAAPATTADGVVTVTSAVGPADTVTVTFGRLATCP